MDEMYFPLSGDSETKGWLDQLVAKGFLDESTAEDPETRRFLITAKGERFLAITEELTRLIEGGLWNRSKIIWERN